MHCYTALTVKREQVPVPSGPRARVLPNSNIISSYE